LDVIINNNLDFDGYGMALKLLPKIIIYLYVLCYKFYYIYFSGACEGTLTCSTCHVILDSKDYDALPDKPSDEELDMLDLAYNLTDT